MANLYNLNSEGGGSIVSDDSQPTLTLVNTGGGEAVRLAAASAASTAVISLGNKSFTSAISIVFAASANWAGMGVIRVQRTDGSLGWIPVLPNGVVTAAVPEA